MTEWQLKTPVALLIFNRPDTTEKVFETIRQAKPPKLLVVADGPRADRPGEAQKCAAARAIVERIDWDCQVFKNYSETNLGCRHRVSSGLDWVFETVEEAIILEDDCLPHPSFFRFCEELLERYRHVTQVFSISGNNLQFGNNPLDESYYFSCYNHIWGWATWRRTWKLYDLQMTQWERLKGENWLESIFDSPQAIQHWHRIFQLAHDGFDTWDYSLVFTCWLNQGVTILPKVNLVSNIGFGEDATHTKSAGSLSNLPTQAIEFPLKHPSSIVRNIQADNFTEKHLFSGGSSLKVQIKNSTLNLDNKNFMTCKICDAITERFGSNKLLNKYDVSYFKCSNCGFVQTEEPYWLDEAYSSAIASSDVGLVSRNLMFSKITSNLIVNLFDRQGTFLDYGGGYGLFVRLMRDLGLNFYWHDRYASNLFAQGFEVEQFADSWFELVTAFELFEHFDAPLQEIEKLLSISRNILFSTELLPNSNPKPNEWWYYAPHEGQHISIYTYKSLSILAKKYNLNLYSNGQNLHLLTEKELSFQAFQQSIRYEQPPAPMPSLIPQDYQAAVARVQTEKPSLTVSSKSVKTKSDRRVKILVDGIFFQLYQTGIARLWRSLLEVWSKTDFAKQLLVLDREGTAPKIPGIKYYCIPKYDYNQPEVDRETIQKICDEESIDIFVSSYYTTPVTTPSVFMAYDMIPEVAGYDLTIPMWREKTYAIQHASSYVAISENTAKDLIRFFPNISQDSITVAYCGVSQVFTPASSIQVHHFKQKYGIDKPYFLLAGMRIGYKNASLFFKAFSELPNKQDFEIVCTGGGSNLEGEFQSYVLGIKVHLLQLSDEELRAAYSGATALAFPSQYEGFGLPVLEAMACGCPVITCRQSSLPEVGGNAVIYVNARDTSGMVNALCEVQKTEVRQTLVSAGLERAKQFSWSTMAEKVRDAVLTAANSQQASPRESLQFSEEIKTQIQAYQNSFDRTSLSTLRQTRHKLAQHWLNLPSEQLERDYNSELGKLHLEFWNSGFKNEILTDEEKLFVQQLSAKVARGFNEPDAIQSLLASTLYFYPHQISLQYQRAPIPNWFAPSYMQFMFESPRLFKEVGEVERYADYFCGWIDYLHGNIISNPESDVWKYVTSVFTNAANLTPLYFSCRDLKETQEKRAEILELSLTQKGCQLDYTFPDRSTNRPKIRVGILCHNFYPSAETFTVLPVFEHLERHQFEVYLYALEVSNTASEQFARNCSDRFTHLNSQNLNEWVQSLRTDDLDIILIGSNITARSYPFTLLSMHRLARIQTVSLADPVTTGMRNIDRYIAGNLTVSQTAQNSYREQLVKIQGSGLCFRFPPDPAPTLNPTRQSWGATDETIVYISGSNFRKINPEVRHTWAKILSAVPNSILALYPFGPNWGRHPQLELPFYQQMQATLAEYGVATNRLVLIKTLPTTADIQKCLELADIYLDSYPYSGAASALDPLKIGLPLVTMEGIELRHRQSAALLQELQIPDLIARSEAEYIQLAVSLGTNPQLRQQKRQDIQAKMQQTPQFLDSKAYGLQMGNLLQNVLSDRNIKPTETAIAPQIAAPAIANERWVVTPEILNRICGCLNLYKIDPSDNTTLTTLRQLRHQLSESLLNIAADELDNLYQSDIGKAYQAYLKSGMQKEPLEPNEQSFLQQLTQQGVGLTNPKALNALMGAMLYYAPGTMKVQNYRDRLPTWLIPDYEQVFEQNPTPTSSAPTQNTSPSQSSDIPQLSTEFLNRLLGCVNLYEIDPSESSTIVELHQLRRKLAEYWFNLPVEQLETVYKTEVGQRYTSLLKSGFQKESDLETDRLFLQEITQIASSTAHPKSLNAMLAAMLYYPPDRLKLQNARTRLPDWLINDYEQVFARV